MTFEAFFLKKKIDLDLLRVGKPDVFAEFVSHFEQMSEKSFDHTKKYWFNNLRIAYPLSEEKELALKEAFKPKVDSHAIVDVETATVSSQAQTVSSPPAFKPRFKVPVSKIVEGTEPLVESSEPENPVEGFGKPAGFKPRFKAGITKPVESVEDKQEVEKIEEALTEAPVVEKPARFKPRFKAGITKPAEAVEVKEEAGEEPVVEKPIGFKPRFKAGVTKPADVPEPKSEIKSDETSPEENEVMSKPAGFKPRFKAPRKDE